MSTLGYRKWANSVLRNDGEIGGMGGIEGIGGTEGMGGMRGIGGIGGMKFDFFYTAGTKHRSHRSESKGFLG